MDFSFRKGGLGQGLTPAPEDSYHRWLLLPTFPMNITGDRGTESRNAKSPAFLLMQGSLSHLAGTSGSTGVRVAKEGLRALRMEKSLLDPGLSLVGGGWAGRLPILTGLGCGAPLKQMAPVLLQISFVKRLYH